MPPRRCLKTAVNGSVDLVPVVVKLQSTAGGTMEAACISDGVSCVDLQLQDSRMHYTISKCQNLMCTFGDVKTKASFWSFENFRSFWLLLPESKLRVSLRFAGNEHPLETAFLWLCFNALTRLKFPNTEKLILLPSLLQVWENFRKWKMVNTAIPLVREVIVPFWHYLQIQSWAEK